MARVCTVCTHSSREAVDQALIESTPNRRIAARYGLSEQALRRHKAVHLSGQLVESTKAHEITRADSLLTHLQDLQARALAILSVAEASGEFRTALAAIREVRGNLELLAKLLSELRQQQVATPGSEVPPELVKWYHDHVESLSNEELDQLIEKLEGTALITEGGRG